MVIDEIPHCSRCEKPVPIGTPYHALTVNLEEWSPDEDEVDSYGMSHVGVDVTILHSELKLILCSECREDYEFNYLVKSSKPTE